MVPNWGRDSLGGRQGCSGVGRLKAGLDGRVQDIPGLQKEHPSPSMNGCYRLILGLFICFALENLSCFMSGVL